jgi:hypothetical protein
MEPGLVKAVEAVDEEINLLEFWQAGQLAALRRVRKRILALLREARKCP